MLKRKDADRARVRSAIATEIPISGLLQQNERLFHCANSGQVIEFNRIDLRPAQPRSIPGLAKENRCVLP